jgi:hypothetical protein
MMILVVSLGVTASCFLKGPIATVLTFSLIIVGYWFRGFMEHLASFEFTGGGPFESVVRMVTHMNIQTNMDPGVLTTVVKSLDSVILGALWVVQHIIPNFEHFGRLNQYVPNGFDVSWNSALLPCLATTAAFLVPCVVLGYFSLKLRELETK